LKQEKTLKKAVKINHKMNIVQKNSMISYYKNLQTLISNFNKEYSQSPELQSKNNKHLIDEKNICEEKFEKFQLAI
jgi:hypothetical protein